MEPDTGERKVVHLGPMESEMLMRPRSHKMLVVWTLRRKFWTDAVIWESWAQR